MLDCTETTEADAPAPPACSSCLVADGSCWEGGRTCLADGTPGVSSRAARRRTHAVLMEVTVTAAAVTWLPTAAAFHSAAAPAAKAAAKGAGSVAMLAQVELLTVSVAVMGTTIAWEGEGDGDGDGEGEVGGEPGAGAGSNGATVPLLPVAAPGEEPEGAGSAGLWAPADDWALGVGHTNVAGLAS